MAPRKSRALAPKPKQPPPPTAATTQTTDSESTHQPQPSTSGSTSSQPFSSQPSPYSTVFGPLGFPPGSQACSQCKSSRPYSEFPVRIQTLFPYQVCKLHGWYWTEEKKAVHWAPEFVSSWDAMVSQMATNAGPEAGWIVAGTQDDRAAITDRIMHAGDWKLTPLPARKSRAKAQENPPPPIAYSFKLQSKEHTHAECSLDWTAPLATGAPSTSTSSNAFATAPDSSSFTRAHTPDRLCYCGQELRLNMTFHPHFTKWTITLRPEGPHIGQGPWRAARKENAPLRDKVKREKAERAARVQERVAIKEANGGKRARIRAGRGKRAQAAAAAARAMQEEAQEERSSPVRPPPTQTQTQTARPTAAENLLALALAATGESPHPSSANHEQARELIAALQTLGLPAGASTLSSLSAAPPASSPSNARRALDTARTALARTPSASSATTNDAPPPKKRARATLTHLGPAPAQPAIWPPPAAQPSVAQAAQFVSSLGAVLSQQNFTRRTSGRNGAQGGLQPLSLGQLLASPLFEPPLIPQRRARAALTSSGSRRSHALDADEVDELEDDELTASEGDEEDEEDLGESDGEGGEYVETPAGGAAGGDVELTGSEGDEESILDSDDARTSSEEEGSEDWDDEEDDEDEDEDEEEGDWLTGFVKGQMEGLAEGEDRRAREAHGSEGN